MSILNSQRNNNEINGLHIGYSAVISAILALIFTVISRWYGPFDVNTPRFILENIGTAFGIIAFLGALALCLKHMSTYSIFVGKKTRNKLDERQLKNRGQAFERAFMTLLVLVLIVPVLVNMNDTRIHSLCITLLIAGVIGIPPLFAIMPRKKD